MLEPPNPLDQWREFVDWQLTAAEVRKLLEIRALEFVAISDYFVATIINSRGRERGDAPKIGVIDPEGLRRWLGKERPHLLPLWDAALTEKALHNAT